MITEIIQSDSRRNLQLAMHRIQLAADGTTTVPDLAWPLDEVCIYVLTGSVDIALSAPDTSQSVVRLTQSRRTVQEPSVSILRLPACNGFDIAFTLASYAADILCVTRNIPATFCVAGQYLTQSLCHNHHVGTGTHERWVREVSTPPGYTIHCGETVNVPGGWSSWPSHCAPDEAGRYAEHEELFFVITPGYGLMHCDGKYPDGTDASRVQELHNGQALRTPLGSHEVVFSPGDWGYYAWFYRSFLQKQYNKWATDAVKTYVK